MGVIAGRNEENGVIEKCVSDLSVSVDSTYNKHSYYGGITGYTQGNITDCVNNGAVSFDYQGAYRDQNPSIVGGIAGQVSGANIENCVNNGDITRNPCDDTQIGGIVGQISGECTVKNCTNNGNISCIMELHGFSAGGVIGHIEKNGICKIEGCENTADVTAGGADKTSQTYIGGIVGQAESPTTVTECVNSGDMSGRGDVGGILGRGVGCAIDQCTNSGNLSCTSTTIEANGTATGGIAGRLLSDGDGNPSTVTGCVNTGTVETQRGSKGYISGSSTSEPEDYQDNLFVQYDDTISGNGRGDNFGDAGKDNMEAIDPEDIPEGGFEEAIDEAARTDITVSLKDKAPNADDPDTIYLTDDGDKPAEAYIVLSADRETAEIYRYMSSEFTFNTDKDCEYVITPCGNTVITDLGEVEVGDGMKQHKYGFNLDGNPASKTGNKITIAKIELVSYGQHDINVVNGVVQTAKNSVFNPGVDDNIVYTYKYDNTMTPETEGKLHIEGVGGEGEEDGTWHMEKTISMQDVVINVMFPNMVETKADDGTTKNYDAMKMSVSVKGGNELDEDGAPKPFERTIYLGDNGEEAKNTDETIKIKPFNFNYTDPEAETEAETPNANGYRITMDVPVPDGVGNRFTFTFKGEGYRTYSVDGIIKKTDDGKAFIVTVWNNVMDEDKTVLISDGSESEKGTVRRQTFLAGDIVMDNKIALYDLSAVVAYFGKNEGDMSSYIKYDLNRDGQIDSKDIAMVLVSWGY